MRALRIALAPVPSSVNSNSIMTEVELRQKVRADHGHGHHPIVLK